jgi:hypothetical protein
MIESLQQSGLLGTDLMRRFPGLLVFVLCGLVSLGGCAFTPERAIAAEIRTMEERWQDMQVRSDTVQIRQRQPWQGGLVCLVSFETVRSSGERSDCLFTYQTRQRGLAWEITGAGGGCGPPGGDGRPISVSSGQHSGSGQASLSHVCGLVYEPAVVTVQVVWEDGQEQRADVVSGSYLALRGGQHGLSQVQALNAQGEIVYTFENPLPAPGKTD